MYENCFGHLRWSLYHERYLATDKDMNREQNKGIYGIKEIILGIWASFVMNDKERATNLPLLVGKKLGYDHDYRDGMEMHLLTL